MEEEGKPRGGAKKKDLDAIKAEAEAKKTQAAAKAKAGLLEEEGKAGTGKKKDFDETKAHNIYIQFVSVYVYDTFIHL